MLSLRAVARRVRRALEAEILLVRGVLPTDLEGYCAVGAWMLVGELRGAGYAADFVYGCFDGSLHCWAETRRHIVDVTACQFGLPKTLVLPKRARGSSDALGGYVEEKRGESAVRAVRTWEEMAPSGWRLRVLEALCH